MRIRLGAHVDGNGQVTNSFVRRMNPALRW